MRVRRVVTGHDADGKAVIASDTEVDGFRPSLTPGSEFHRLWGGDEPPSFPDHGVRARHDQYFPPIGGFRFGFFAVPPHNREPGGPPAARRPRRRAGRVRGGACPDWPEHMEPDAPGMHTTSTIDFEVVLEGEVWLELDDGVEVHLKPGDTVVQNGTRHAWRNHGETTARLAVFIVGAHHAGF